ncbi:microsomal glutathione S-transferase 1-like [Planococcus citri]|uniref:microsomal glutathione S-transferase 1-like n=1 Tax=Planococcus citri TaxID=170843 RepID=UPI0031F9CAD6
MKITTRLFHSNAGHRITLYLKSEVTSVLYDTNVVVFFTQKIMVEINLEDPVLRGFLFYVSVLVAKVLLMAFLTARQRFTKKVFISSEDASMATRALQMRDATVKYDDDDIERVRRAHLNDLENIPAFIFIGFVYVLTKPDPFVALNIFRLYTLCRILHTIVYAVFVIPQPSRVIVWTIGYALTFYMIIMSGVTFFNP